MQTAASRNHSSTNVNFSPSKKRGTSPILFEKEKDSEELELDEADNGKYSEDNNIMQQDRNKSKKLL